MRLLFVTASLVTGGAERHTITLANRLAERGHECHAAYVKNDAEQLERLSGASSVQCLQARRYLDLRSITTLSAMIERVRPCVVVAVNQYALLYAWAALRRARARSALMVTFHSTFQRHAKERLQMLAYRPLFWSADCVVFVCQRQRRHWARRALFGRRDEVIYNGVDLGHWRVAREAERLALRRALGFAAGDYVVGISAVLRPEKNHVQLVEAIARLRANGLPARALMIGDGETRAAVEALARRRGIAEQVTITGLQRDVRPFLAACDTVALTSFTEAFSLAAIEAMACGRPVVHSEVGGAAEMVSPGENGFLYPVGDTVQLVERLARLADPALRGRMGVAARAIVEDRFSERAMVDRYESVLKELDQERNKRANIRRPAGAH